MENMAIMNAVQDRQEKEDVLDTRLVLSLL
jgi:hypothetical protein